MRKIVIEVRKDRKELVQLLLITSFREVIIQQKRHCKKKTKKKTKNG